MKQLLYILALIIVACLVSGCETDYLRIGKKKEVVPAASTPQEQVDIQNRTYIANHGRRAFVWGLAVLVGGGVLSAAFKMYLPRKVGDVVYYAGAGLSVYGLVLMESAKRLHVLGFVAIVVLGGILLWKVKYRGIGKEAKK